MKRTLALGAFKTLVFLGLVWLSLTLALPALTSSGFSLAMVGMDALFIGIALKDLNEERIPNLITYPMMTAALGRAIILRDPSFLAYWGVLWLAWGARFIGAGDAKLLMGLFGLWPNLRLVYVVAATILVTGIPFLAYKYRREWRSALRGLAWRLFTLQILPSPEDFQKEAVPYAFSFCLAGGIYLWMLSQGF